MITALQILEQSWKRLGEQVLVLMPNVLAMLLILLGGWIGAHLVALLLRRTSSRVEKSLGRWGVPAVIGGYGQTRPAQLIARSAYWVIFACAVLMGINALNTELGTRLVTSAFFYLPRLATAGLIVVAGLLLGRFLARGALIWAVNEGLGPARWIAGGVRVGVGLLTYVAATEQLDVGRTAVLATFVILLSGTVLAVALAVGLGSRRRVEEWLDRRASFLAEAGQEERLEHL